MQPWRPPQDVLADGLTYRCVSRRPMPAAAMEIIDRDGADALSMRRLARALDREPLTPPAQPAGPRQQSTPPADQL